MKRFVETNRWSDPWFRRLSPTTKCLWDYLTDNCDRVGLIDLDLEAASFHIGSEITKRNITELGDRVQRLENGKIFIPQFITFQYGELSEKCPAHKPVLKLIAERNLSMNGKGYQYPIATPPIGLPNSIREGMEEEEDKNRKGECEGDSSAPVPTPEDIYRVYPRKVARPDAIRAIRKATLKHGSAYLLERTIAYAKTQMPNDRFTPHPATWFNAERFNDDPATWAPVASDPKQSPQQKSKRDIEYDEWKAKQK